jgi:hypothetical protein
MVGICNHSSFSGVSDETIADLADLAFFGGGASDEDRISDSTGGLGVATSPTFEAAGLLK